MNLLIWDFDGTLAYRDGMWSGALLDVLHQHDPGRPLTREDIRPHLRRGFPWHTPEKPHPHLSDPDSWWANLQPVFAGAYAAVGVRSDRAAELARYVRGAYCDPGAWSVYPDVWGTLDALLRDGWIHVVLSNHVPELENIVAALGLRSNVSGVFSSAAIGHEKPSAAAFQHVLARVGVPEHAWMIGDNPIADIAGAAAAGIPGILVRSRDPRVPYCCGDLTKIRAVINSLRCPSAMTMSRGSTDV